MTNQEHAQSLFTSGFNCSQSVFVPFAETLGMDSATALKLTTGFGAGMARMQETCGAVTGAYLAIGLRHGRIRVEDELAREETYILMLDFKEAFERLHQSTNCRVLLGIDFQTPEGNLAYHNNNLSENVCLKCVGNAAAIVEKLFEENPV